MQNPNVVNEIDNIPLVNLSTVSDGVHKNEEIFSDVTKNCEGM